MPDDIVTFMLIISDSSTTYRGNGLHQAMLIGCVLFSYACKSHHDMAVGDWCISILDPQSENIVRQMINKLSGTILSNSSEILILMTY